MSTSNQAQTVPLTIHDLEAKFGALSTTRAVDTPSPPTVNHLEEFFANYPDFAYCSTNSATHEFHRLGCLLSRQERDRAWGDFRDALVMEFNKIYGKDQNDLGSWQGLCRTLNIAPVPATLRECRKAVKTTYVNLVDLVDLRNSKKPIELFSSEDALSKYTMSTGKFFPRDNAYAGGLLKYLLRQIMVPRVPGAKRRGLGVSTRGQSRSSDVQSSTGLGIHKGSDSVQAGEAGGQKGSSVRKGRSGLR